MARSRRRFEAGRRGAFAVVATALAVALAAPGGGTRAAFTASATDAANAYATDALAAPTALTLTGQSPVALSWTATTSAWAAGTRVLRATSAGGPYAQVAQISGLATTTYGESPGLGAYHYAVRSYFGSTWQSADSNVASRTSTTFVFGSTAANVGSSCNTAAQRDRDMTQGLVPTNPEETLHRTGGTGTLVFCTTTFRAGEALAAGTTTVTGWFTNTAGSTCNVTAALSRNGTVALGSGALTVPGQTGLTQRSWSFATSATTAAAGDRLNLFLTWQGVKACDDTDLHYDGAATPSSVTVPTITGVA